MGEDNKGHEAAGRNKSVCFSLEEAVPGGGAVCRSPAGTLQEHFRNVLGTLDLNDRMAQTHEAAITLFFLSHVLADSPAKRLQLIKVGQVPSGDPVPPVGPVPSGDPVPPVGPDLTGSDPCFILFCLVCLASDVFGGSCSPPGCAEDR